MYTKVYSGKIKWLILHNMIPQSVEFSQELNSEDMLDIAQLISNLRTISFTNTCLSRNSELLRTTCSSTLMNLSFESSTVEDVCAIASCNNLTFLSLFHCPNVSDESFTLGVTGCVKLEQCYLHNCAKLRAPSIAAVLTHCVVLKELNIGGVFRLQQVFEQFNSVSKLRMFECVDSYRKRQLTGETIQALAAALPDVTTLHLNYHYNSVTDVDIDVLTRKCQSLTSLTLCGFVGITDDVLWSIANNLPELQTISVDHCSRVTDVGVIALSHSLTSLYSINLQNLSITNAAVQAFGTRCRALKFLNVNDCRLLTDDAFQTLNVTCLTYLDISRTRVTGSFAAHVLSANSALHVLSCFACEHLDATFVQSMSPVSFVSGSSLKQINVSSFSLK
eukprot:gene10932-12755_t